VPAFAPLGSGAPLGLDSFTSARSAR
jgi:hypothetical protein